LFLGFLYLFRNNRVSWTGITAHRCPVQTSLLVIPSSPRSGEKEWEGKFESSV
jgi:hypothetical protein